MPQNENEFLQDARVDYFGRVEQSVMFDEQIPYGYKALYAVICTYAGAKEICWPGQETLARVLGVTPRAIRKWVAGLRDLKILDIQKVRNTHGGWQHNQYTLLSYRNPDTYNTGTQVPIIQEPRYLLKKTIKDNKENKVSSGETTATTVREGLKKAQEKKHRVYSPETIEIVSYWNELSSSLQTKPRPSIHKTDTRSITLDKIDAVVRALLSGTLQQTFPHEMTDTRLSADKVDVAITTKKWTIQEIKDVLQKYVLHFQEGYWPFEGKNKARLPRSLALVFLSERADSRPSWFLFDACHEIQQREAALDPAVYKVLVDAYTKHRHKPTHTEEEGLRRAANEIVRFHRELDNSAVPYYSLRYEFEIGTVLKFVRKFSEFLVYYIDNVRGDLELYVGQLRPGSKTWDAFSEYLREQGLTIAITDDEKKIAGALQNAVRYFRLEVGHHGLDVCRKKYGARIPYLTQDAEIVRAKAWAELHPVDKYLAHEWGRGLWAEIKKGWDKK